MNNMSDRIPGINRTSLWRAWKAVRGELRKCSIRDVVDHLEYDINPNKWINQLLAEIAEGRYEPRSPRRFTGAKSNGFSRRMTMPEVPDLVLYRAISDYLYRRAKRFEQGQVFCERSEIPREIRPNVEPIHPSLKSLDEWVMDYNTSSRKAFRAWLIYNQYRKLLVFRRVHKYVVLTDITNFFDSVLYSRIGDALSQLSIPPRMIGLLFFLLERFSSRDAYSESPRIGLPVDEFSCSRKLAHMVLFPHDDRMIAAVGAESYVRWMDDQNFGVTSRADGLRCLARVNESRGRLHFTANAKKSQVLKIAEARRHFHFDHNDRLDQAELLLTRKPVPRRDLVRLVNAVYRQCKQHEGIGQWDKVLKRLYRIAAIAGVRILRRRALRDVLRYPTMASRVSEYMRATGSPAEHLGFVRAVWSNSEQLYPDVNAVMCESLLRLEADSRQGREIAKIAARILRGQEPFAGVERCGTIAPLLILRFGDRRQLPGLRTAFRRGVKVSARSAAVIYAGFGIDKAEEVEQAAAAVLRNPLAELVLMCRAITEYNEVPDRWGLRSKVAFDPVTQGVYIDTRGLAAIRLLGLNTHTKVRAWLSDKYRELLKIDLSDFDKRMLARLWPK
ncbi:MAG: hypothetical protein AB7Q00_08830 [Phycisphaerales bacterium]